MTDDERWFLAVHRTDTVGATIQLPERVLIHLQSRPDNFSVTCAAVLHLHSTQHLSRRNMLSSRQFVACCPA